MKWGRCALLAIITLSAGTVPSIGLAQETPAVRGPELRVHAGALAPLIQQLGGRRIQVVNASLIAVLNPRAFLVEPAGLLRPIASRGRLLVLIEQGLLGVNPELALGHTVNVRGTARTVLGVQVTREVPWPEELTRENIRRYDVGAVVLASSVRTSDGVELVRPGSAPR